MLRRYSSQNLETIPMQSKVLTIGTTGKCDVKLNAKGVHPVHASIEQNPSSGTFWLKDHSLAGRTTVNGHYVHGEIELHNGDLVRIGRAQPFVFEKRSFLSLNGPNSLDDTNEKSVSQNAILPILGVKKRLSVKPSKGGVDRPLTALTKTKRTAVDAAEKKPGRDDRALDRRPSPSSSIETNSINSLSTVSSDTVANTNSAFEQADEIFADYLEKRLTGIRLTSNIRGSVGNHLLQRVVRLQDELTRKNIEIDQLRRQKTYPETVLPPSRQHSYYLPYLHDPPSGVTPIERNFELETYRAFLGTVAAKIRSFNEYILRGRQSDFSDVFLAFLSMTKDPIPQKMIEIERECDIELERKGFTALQRSHLPDLFRNDRKANIPKVATEIEQLVPVIREACATAGESIRVCSVFTKWSRHLGDQIRIEGLTGTQLMNAIEELKEDFYRNRMEDHWLLPSISPLLSLTATELEKSRENSSIAETQPGDSISSGGDKNIFKNAEASAENSSRVHHNDTSEKEDKSEDVFSEVKPNEDSEDSVAQLLAEAEMKSAQLETQLSVLQRKISESKDVNESTRMRLNQLLHRLNSSTNLIKTVGEEDTTEELFHKQSVASIMSLNITENDLQHATKASNDEKAGAPSTTREILVVDSERNNGQRNQENLDLNDKQEADGDEVDNESHFSYGADLDDELYQLYCDSSRHLGWPTKLMVQFSQTCAVVVNKELLCDVIKCSRSLLCETVHGFPLTQYAVNGSYARSEEPLEDDEHEAHSLGADSTEGTKEQQKTIETPETETGRRDDTEADNQAGAAEEDEDDVEGKIELKQTTAQEGANVGSRPPSEGGRGSKASDSGDPIAETMEQDGTEGVELRVNEIGNNPEILLESSTQSPEPSGKLSETGAADANTEEDGKNSGDGTPLTDSPTAEEVEHDEGEDRTHLTDEGADQNPDEAEVKVEENGPSSPVANQDVGEEENNGEQNFSEGRTPDKENVEIPEEGDEKGGEESPLPSSRAVNEADQNPDDAEGENGEETPSQDKSDEVGDLPQRSESAATAGSVQSVSRTSIPGALPEHELNHKYHIQSHINTATRTPFVVQTVPVPRSLFRSPITTRKSASVEEAKPVLLQPRFVH